MKFGQDNKYKVIVHNTTYLSVLEILKMVMPFVALPYLISTVGADKYGLVVFAQAIISYFIIFILFESLFILSVRLFSFPSILTSKYILIAIGNPTLATRVCKLDSMVYKTKS